MKTSILKEFGLENFRVFKEKASFELAPITLFTGANSSGKSSVIKALKLMQNFHKDNCYEKDYKSPKLDFREDDSHAYHHQLGDFEFVINDENKENKEFSVFYKIPMNVGELFEYYAIYSDEKKKHVDSLNIFKGLEQNLFIENVYSFDNYSNLKNGNLIKSSVYAEYNEERIKIIEWHLETWPSSGPDSETKESIDFKDSKWDYYADYYSVIKLFKFLENKSELLNEFINTKDYNAIYQLPQILRNFFESYARENTFTNLTSQILQFSEEQLINFEQEVWKVLVSIHPEIHNQLTFNEFLKKTRELEKEVEKFSPNWQNNSFLLPAELVLFFGKNETALLNLKDYIQNPFNPITNFIKLGIFVNSESFDQWISVLNYLELLEYYIISSGENIVLEFYEKDKTKYENYYRSAHFKNAKQPDFLFTFCENLNLFLNSAFQLYFAECEFVEATKANTQRLFTFTSQGTSFNKYLADYIDRSHTEEVEVFFNKWLSEFEIGDKLDYETELIRGVGVQLNIIKDGKSRNIVDFGYGITQMIAHILRIVSATETGKTTVLIEEPESNLHPKLQSKLADLFLDAYKTFGLNFIVETHSEYLIRKLQYLTAKKSITPQDTSIYYFGNPDETKREKTERQIISIEIESNGQLSKHFGTGFFDEADNLAFELFKFSFN